MSMYGNITQHIPRTNFKFSAIYPSLKAAYADLERYNTFIEQSYNQPNLQPTYKYEIPLNGYILIDYTKNPLFKEESEINRNTIFEDNKNDDINYQEGSLFAPADYHYTVWQKQKLSTFGDAEYIAISRMHSILPTFETWGNYHIDVLEPLSSSPDIFGAGKIWYYPLDPIQFISADDKELQDINDLFLVYQPTR